ncbi:MAG: hypothetical protein AAB019_00390 [Planctomycetota bacterium]
MQITNNNLEQFINNLIKSGRPVVAPAKENNLPRLWRDKPTLRQAQGGEASAGSALEFTERRSRTAQGGVGMTQGEKL